MEKLIPHTWQEEQLVSTHLKSKRKVWNVDNPPIRSAYEKFLREKDITRKVYEVNPYAEVHEIRKGIYGILTDSLDGYGDPWMFLIEGSEKALLIDTSFGLGNLKGLIREVIGEKELIVVNTHCHFDHAYGNCQFDRVYCHEYEVYGLKKAMNPSAWDYLFDENGEGKWTSFPREDMIPYKTYEIVGVPDGHVFQLGNGHEVELIYMPGHTCGHCGFLDRKNRIFFGGDNVCFGTVGIGVPAKEDPNKKYACVEALYASLVKLIDRKKEFGVVFPSHGILEVGTGILDDLAETCKKVLENPENYDDKQIFYRNGKIPVERFCKIIYESGYLTYQKNQIYLEET
jgi:glyoxylase-like metal-dependent hydrolase (beta-lactamase superfamily II)